MESISKFWNKIMQTETYSYDTKDEAVSWRRVSTMLYLFLGRERKEITKDLRFYWFLQWEDSEITN